MNNRRRNSEQFGQSFGRAVHDVLEALDLDAAVNYTLESTRQIVALCCEKAAANGVAHLTSTIAKRVLAVLDHRVIMKDARAGHIQEMPLEHRWEVMVGGRSCTVVMSGRADLVYGVSSRRRGDLSYVVLDFKTSQVSDSAKRRDLTRRHLVQLGCYGIALREQGMAVARLEVAYLLKERTIVHSFSGKAVELALDAAQDAMEELAARGGAGGGAGGGGDGSVIRLTPSTLLDDVYGGAKDGAAGGVKLRDGAIFDDDRRSLKRFSPKALKRRWDVCTAMQKLDKQRRKS